MNFLWRGRPPKVAKSTITMPVEKGGLNAPDLIKANKACRISWIGRMLKLKGAVFIRALEKRLSVRLSDLINADFEERWLKNRPIPEFYKQMLVWFRNVCPAKVPECGKEVRQQVIWHNKAVRVGNRTLFHRRLAGAGNRLIDDFVDARGEVLDHQAFSNQHGISSALTRWFIWAGVEPFQLAGNGS